MPSTLAAFSSAPSQRSQWPLSWAPQMWTLLPLLVGVLLQNPTAAQFLVPPGFDAVSFCKSQALESGDCASAVLFQGYQRSTTEDAIELVENGLWWPQVATRVQEVADEWAPVMQQEHRRSEQPSLAARSAGALARLPGRVLRYASAVEDGHWQNASGTPHRWPEAVANLNSGSLVVQKQDGGRHHNATTASPPQQPITGDTASSKSTDDRISSGFSSSKNNRLALLATQAASSRPVIPGSVASRTTNQSDSRIGSNSSSITNRLALLEAQAEASIPASMLNEPSQSPLPEHWRVAFLAGLAHAMSHARRLWDDGSGYTQTFVLIGVNFVLGILLCLGLAAAFRGREGRELPFLGSSALGQQTPSPQQAGAIQPPKRLQPASSSPRPPDLAPFREREAFEPRFPGGITSPHPEPRDLSLRGKMNAAATLAASPLLMTPSRSLEDSAAKDDRPSIIDAILCVGLIVPEECECTLLVPHLAPRPISTQVTIEDVERTPALKAVFHLPTQEGRCLILSDVDETSNLFAYCVRDFSNLALTIYGAEERHFGLIRMRGSKPSAGFEVITRKQAQLHIRCATSGEPRTFTDGHGRLLAVAEPVPDEHALRVVRIGPGVDAGLVVLSTLASDLLKAMLQMEANQ